VAWKIFSTFRMGKGVFSRTPLKERIAQAIFRIETQLSKLEQTASKLHQRDREMFERCIGAKASGDLAHAAIYANECAEIRKMAKIVLSSQLALERAVLRLKTIEEIGDALTHLGPILSIMKETKSKLTGIIPEVSHELEEIGEFLNSTVSEAGSAPKVDLNITASSTEAKRILDEATAIAEQKLNEIYPELPVPPEAEKASVQPEPVAEAEGIGEVEVKPSTPIAPAPEEIKESLYKYLKNCRGELNPEKCCSELGISKEILDEALNLLQQEGKIKLQ
jgi:division protein CdvB (Snf7/Vps24/ESCRT-III family)